MPSSENLFSRVCRENRKKQTQILGIMASPRKGGNADILLEEVLKAARQSQAITEKIIINDLSFIPCQACEDTREDGRCKIEDDFQKIYEAVLRADSIVVASPIYFGSISAQLKMLIDRFQCYWRAKYVTKTIDEALMKQGGFICVQASSENIFFDNARSIMKNFFNTAGIEYCREIFCSGLEKKGSVKEKPDYMEKAAAMGEKLAQFKKGKFA
ncbi:MAG: flavodoxin family protein [Candidatus Omnitrophica bacterium]|nr:flavodoxin family protein [Candidatus Omnitrophota bacterium]